METKPQINQNMFCFYQVLYKDFTTCALHFSSFLCAFLRSLSASSLPPDHGGTPMDSLSYVRALYWGHQNWTQDFRCNFFRAEQTGRKIPTLTCWPCSCCHSPVWGWPLPQECPCADSCWACCPSGPSVESCLPATCLPACTGALGYSIPEAGLHLGWTLWCPCQSISISYPSPFE